MVPHVLCPPAAGTTFSSCLSGESGAESSTTRAKLFDGLRALAQRRKPKGPKPRKRRDRGGE